jgi:hypothetical protein
MNEKRGVFDGGTGNTYEVALVVFNFLGNDRDGNYVYDEQMKLRCHWGNHLMMGGTHDPAKYVPFVEVDEYDDEPATVGCPVLGHDCAETRCQRKCRMSAFSWQEMADDRTDNARPAYSPDAEAAAYSQSEASLGFSLS